MPETRERSLLLLSPRYLREANAMAAAAGWTVTQVRRSDDVIIAYEATPARIALIDARGALVAGLNAVREIATSVEARRGALLVLLSHSDADAAGAVFSAGATQVLTSPFSASQLADALRFAARSVIRLDAAARGLIPGNDMAQRRDPLTGLATVAHARGWVELLLGAPLASDPAVVVLMVALGRFGQLNAAYGRAVADQLLQDVAGRLRTVAAALPTQDKSIDPRMVARLAGAEFALVLAAPVSLTDAMGIAQRITDAFALPFARDGHIIHLGCRIGIAAANDELRHTEGAADILFRHAAAALITARAREPGSIEVFQQVEGDDPMIRMAGLESDLRRAAQADQLEILFQPQVDIDSGTIVGAEALVRWQHPVLGELPAQTLLDVAASAELATQIGDHIRTRALLLGARAAPELAALRLSVNVTAADLAVPEFAERLLDAIATTGFPANRLTIELTEGDLIENLDTTSLILARLRALGIRIALDDFGTGYSSLAYLRQLPLDYLKIDKRLIADLGGNGRDRVVVHGVVEMARALGICVIAEGVETALQMAAVAATGCDWYQGYHCAAPMRIAELTAFVRDWNAQAQGVLL